MSSRVIDEAYPGDPVMLTVDYFLEARAEPLIAEKQLRNEMKPRRSIRWRLEARAEKLSLSPRHNTSGRRCTSSFPWKVRIANKRWTAHNWCGPRRDGRRSYSAFAPENNCAM